MGEVFITRRGGKNKSIIGEFNLKIQQIISSDLLPTTGVEGEIYVLSETESDNEILTFPAFSGTNYVQHEEPVGAFSAGDVWVSIIEVSPIMINVAEKGSMVIGIKGVYIWFNDAWVQADFYVWYEDRWVKNGGYLIEAGITNVDFTISGANLVLEDGYLRVDAKSGASGYYRTTSTIDLTGYSTIKMTGYNTGAFSAYIAVWNASDTRTNGTKLGSSVAEKSMDISSLTGDYYVGVFGNSAGSGGATFDIYVYDYWLE